MSCQEFLTVDQRLSDGAQVVGDDAPADPALHAILAVIATALQLVPTFQPTDPSFDAGPPVAPTLKPALALVRLTCGRRAASLRQHHTSDDILPRRLFVLVRRHLAITYQQGRRTAELTDVLLQARHQLGRIVRIARQDRVATDDAAFDLAQPDYSPKLGRLAQLALANDHRMRFEDTDQLLAGRHLLAVQHPPPGLGDHLCDARNERLQRGIQAQRLGAGLLRERRLKVLCLSDHLGRQANQAPVAVLQCVRRAFPAPSRRVNQPFHHPTHTAGAVAKGRTAELRPIWQHSFGPQDGPRQHPHAIAQQRGRAADAAWSALSGWPSAAGWYREARPRRRHDRTAAAPGYH